METAEETTPEKLELHLANERAEESLKTNIFVPTQKCENIQRRANEERCHPAAEAAHDKNEPRPLCLVVRGRRYP